MSVQIGIVIPAYNEAAVIAKTIKSIPKKLAGKPVQIIVVNDGSVDSTDKAIPKLTQVHLINHLINSGAGAATRTGINYAKDLGLEYLITMDADGQHDVKDVEKIASEILKRKADFIIGSRLIQSGGMPWYRKIGNKFLSFITFAIFGVWVTDSQSGLKALNRKAMEKITFHSNHYAFCSEMLWRAKQERLRIKEIPVSAIYTEYSLAKGQSNWGALDIIKQLIKRRILGLLDG